MSPSARHLTAIALAFTATTRAEVLLTDSFDDGAAGSRWVAQSTVGADSLADFNFNYGTLGIPPAPNSTGGTTTGMALTTSRTAGAIGGISVSPNDFMVYGDFSLTFDAWLNYRGPLGSQFPESLRHATFGWGSDGSTTEWTGGTSPGAMLFAMSNNGAVPDDFRLIYNNTDVGDIHFTAGSRDHSAPQYTSLFPSQSAPAAQQGIDPVQIGTTQAGEAGFAWHEVDVRRVGDTVTWSVNGTILLTKDVSDAPTNGHEIFFGISDSIGMPQMGSTPELNAFIVDNVVLESLPDARPVAQSFALDLTKAEKIHPYITDDHGVFSNALITGGANDISLGHNVPIMVMSVDGFDGTSREGNLRLEANLTTWNANNTLIDPQGVHFRFTIHVDGESTRGGGSGFLNGTNNGRLGIDGNNATLGYPIFEENESATFSVQDIEVLAAPAGHALRFASFSNLNFWNYTPDMYSTTPTPSTLQIEWRNEGAGEGTTGPLGAMLNFELVENVSEAEVDLKATTIATEAGAVVELATFAMLMPSGMPTILDHWEIATDTPGFFAEAPTLDALGTLRYTPQAAAGTGSLRIRALDDTGFTPWITVELINTLPDYTDTLPLQPDTFDSLGTLDISGGMTVNLHTDSGIIVNASTFDTVLRSRQLLVEYNNSDPGQVWRVFCVDAMTLSADSTFQNIAGSYGLAIISRGNVGGISLAGSLSFNGADGIPGYDATGGPDAGHGSPGGDGGRIALISNNNLYSENATIAARGGDGGDGGNAYPLPEGADNAGIPGNGGAGGKGGDIIINTHMLYGSTTINIDMRGGNGGAGGTAPSTLSEGDDGPGGDAGTFKLRRGNQVGSLVIDNLGGSGNPNGNYGPYWQYGGSYFLGPVADFRRAYGMSAQGEDDEADWSGNGIPNILYFAFELGDPNSNPSPALLEANMPRLELTPTGYQFSHLKPRNTHHLALYPLQGETLDQRHELDGLNPAVESTYHSEPYDRLIYTITGDTAPKRFFRVYASDGTLGVLNQP